MRLLTLCLCLAALPALAAAPDAGAPEPAPPAVVLPRTEVRTLTSRHVPGVTYKLYVSLPRGHGTDGKAYRVVYLLDADYSFAIARNVVEHLSDRDHLEPLVLVGVAYDGPERYRLNRIRDYTPTHVPDGPYGADIHRHSGGGPAFRRFLAEELIPFVERTYRVRGERTLVGHSMGGLFAAWVAFTTPELFSRYLVVSPSLWHDDKLAFRVEEAFARSKRGPPGRLYLTVGGMEGDAERDMVGDLRAFGAKVEARRYPGLRLRWSVLEDETHNSVFPSALSRGLRFLHDGR